MCLKSHQRLHRRSRCLTMARRLEPLQRCHRGPRPRQATWEETAPGGPLHGELLEPQLAQVFASLDCPARTNRMRRYTGSRLLMNARCAPHLSVVAFWLGGHVHCGRSPRLSLAAPLWSRDLRCRATQRLEAVLSRTSATTVSVHGGSRSTWRGWSHARRLRTKQRGASSSLM